MTTLHAIDFSGLNIIYFQMKRRIEKEIFLFSGICQKSSINKPKQCARPYYFCIIYSILSKFYTKALKRVLVLGYLLKLETLVLTHSQRVEKAFTMQLKVTYLIIERRRATKAGLKAEDSCRLFILAFYPTVPPRHLRNTVNELRLSSYFLTNLFKVDSV